MKSLSGKCYLVTGASSGIGAASVRRLVGAGASVVLTARRAERLTALCAEIDPRGERTLALVGDVTSDADRRRWVAEALGRFGRIDGLVNNAGYGQRGPIEQVELEAIRRNFETNVFALLGLTQLVVPVMRAQGGGRIVNIGSVAGRIARPMSSVYDATKHALEAFSDGLRGELRPWGIDVVLVRPGFVETEFIEAADGESAEVAKNMGPYARYLEGYYSGRRKLRKVAGVPDDIARLVVRALAARRPRSHYAGPGHARVLLALKALLPVRVLDWFVRLKGE